MLVFNMCLKQIFGHNKLLGAQKSWGVLPPNSPLASGLLVKQKFSNLDKNTAALCFWSNKSK